ncbi:universal stress protein [uncultured Cellulomonas sp.]|uniref:universal stress protein n=1 Tax=uncultured Cellulomonas sp. TaxID=189682 RepID=UPI002630E756|nr:universal stress protein [uncultured Cellulomonas sp.]
MRHNGPVVIAVDGGTHSAETIQWGLAEAELRGAEAVLARTYQEPREIAQWSWYPVLDDLRFDTEAKEYLAEQLDLARQDHPDLTISTRLLHGPEVPELRTLSEEAQLLVVGARGHAGRSRLGRVSAHLAAHSQCPVTIVREVKDDASAPVVVGVDGSPSSVVAAQVAAREALLRDLPLVVAHARPTLLAPYGGEGLGLPPLATSDENDPTHRAARQVADQLRAEYPGLDVRVDLVDDDAVHALVEMSHGAALMVVGSRGMGAFRGMLLGAVSNEVVRGADTTVLVVHGLPAQ